MKDQGKKSSIQPLAAGLLGFVGIVGLGSLVILHHGGAAVKAPVSVYAPVDADPGGPSPLRSLRPAEADSSAAANAASPAPVLPADAVGSQNAAALPAPSAAPKDASAAIPAANLVAGAHLDSSGSASSSASAAAAAPKLKTAPARKPFLAPKLDLSKSQGTVASTVHYGVSTRTELMGRAAGPVYNFSGNAGAKQGGQVAADNASASGALQQVDAAQKKLDASDVPDADKAKFDRDLNQIRQTAAAAPAAQ
jgi:hypothetical protein